MSIEISGTRSLYNRLAKIEKSVDQKELIKKCVKVGSQVRIDWLKRTAEGKDRDLRSFKPYSTNYKKYKEKNKNTYRGVVDLAWRGMQGGMLSGMAVKILSDGALIYMNNADSNKIGSYQQNGTHATMIKPKTKKALKFPVADGFAFAKEVYLPGLPKRKFWGLSTKDKAKIRKYLFKYTVRTFR